MHLRNLRCKQLLLETGTGKGTDRWRSNRKKKVWTVSYADDILIASNEEEIKEMIKEFGKYIEELELEINI